MSDGLAALITGYVFNIFQTGYSGILTGFNLGQVFLVVATLVGILRRNYDQVTCISLPLYTPFVCESVCLSFLSH